MVILYLHSNIYNPLNYSYFMLGVPFVLVTFNNKLFHHLTM